MCEVSRSGWWLLLAVSSLVAVGAVVLANVGPAEFGATPASMYVYFGAYLGILLAIRGLLEGHRSDDAPRRPGVLKTMLGALAITGAIYMLSFLGASLLGDDEHVQWVAENILWFVLFGIPLGAIFVRSRLK